MHNRFQSALAIIVLFALAIVSCQKAAPTAAHAATSPNTRTIALLTVGLPTTIVWWGNAPAIPYTDNIPGDIPIRNQYPLGFAVNGEGFVLGTMLTNSKYGLNDYVTDLWQYDPSTVSWTKKSSFPGDAGSLLGAASFVISDNAYIVTGNATWQYNQPTDTWKQKAYIFSVQRSFATAFAINGKGYIGLGSYDGTQQLNDWWVYDPVADSWTQKNNFPGEKRQGAAGFVVDGKGYVVSGDHYANGHGNWGKKVWQYDPVADSWTQKADFPGAGRWNAVAANGTIDGVNVGFVAGGDNDDVAFNDAWEYNPANDSWGELPNIAGGARTTAAGFVIGRSLFIANISVSVLNWSQ